MYDALWAINLLEDEIPLVGHQPEHLVDPAAQVKQVFDHIRYVARQVQPSQQLTVFNYFLNDGADFLTKEPWRITTDAYRRPGYLPLIRELLQREVERILSISQPPNIPDASHPSEATPQAQPPQLELLPGIPWLKSEESLLRLKELLKPYLSLTTELLWYSDKHDLAFLIYALEQHSFIPCRVRPSICALSRFVNKKNSDRTKATYMASQIARLNNKVPYLQPDSDVVARIRAFLAES